MFFLDGCTIRRPPNLRRCWPRKSNPWPICVMHVFSAESCKPRSPRNCSTRGRTSCSSSSLVLPVMMKSSAYRTKCTLDRSRAPRTCFRAKLCANSAANPSKVMFARAGEATPPCGVPASVGYHAPAST